MSDESKAIEKVTTDKQKNAGRVEWGKKLGKIQKDLKAKKHTEQALSDAVHHSFLKWEYGVAVVGIIIGAAALYYQKKSYDVAKADDVLREVVKPVEVKTENKKKRFSDF